MWKSLCTGICVLGVAGLVQGEEKVMKMAEVPGWVLHTAQQAMPGASFTAVQLDTDESMAVFEFKGTTSTGKQLEIDVRPDGALEEIEIVIDKSEVPAPVLQVFEKKFPKFELTKIEHSQRPLQNGLRESWYEFDGKTADGEAVDVEIHAQGTRYLVEPD